MRSPRHIAIEGVIGVGKSTLTRLVAERLGARAIFEPVVENPFLARFYQDRPRYAFQTQLFFLLTRFQQQLELRQGDLFTPSVVCDYLFAKDRIFARLNLAEDEIALYEQVYRLLDGRLPRPDLVVYLQAPTEVLQERIRRRGLSFEQEIPREYLDELSDLYNDFFSSYDESPLLVVHTAELNLVHHEPDREYVLQAIREIRGGTRHLVPLGSRSRDPDGVG
ncbi:deoxynucleoside kinase [Myxococcota bacterium]|nr:deoxynucleoside kinase [Myxococcota bacterium]